VAVEESKRGGRKREGQGSDRPDVGGDEDDDGEGAEPGVSDGGDDVARDGGAGEVAERDDDHAQREGQRYKVEHPHLAGRPSLRRADGRRRSCRCFLSPEKWRSARRRGGGAGQKRDRSVEYGNVGSTRSTGRHAKLDRLFVQRTK
jgi:hypothetical protein